MGARTMFSKFKSSGAAPNILESNPILNHFEIGKQSATAGPENVWKILEGYRKSDGKEVSIFLFEKRSVEKITKPKRKETITETLRAGVQNLERFRHPKILQVIHSAEQCQETLAFASEPVLASLANVLAYEEQKALSIAQSSTTVGQQTQQQQQHNRQMYMKEYELLDMEIKYGLLQITEALSFLHYSRQILHRNVCPSSIMITKKGTWKLFGFEFIESGLNDKDAAEPIPLPQWTNRISKMAQPNLDYLAPEVQLSKRGSILSDMYSFGMVICAIFNYGRPLIQANHNCSEYSRQLDTLEEQVHNILPRVPVPLQEAVSRLLQKESRQRPTAQLLTLIKYFSDPSVYALQFLDVINMKDPTQKAHFYRTTLKEALPYIPRKLWYQHIWPYLQEESRSQEVFAAVLQPMLYIIQNSTSEEYEKIILPTFRSLFSIPKSTQGSVVLLENLHIILEKTPLDVIRDEVLPMLFASFDSPTIQVESAAFVAIANVTHFLDDMVIRRTVLPKIKMAFEKNSTDMRILMKALASILDRLEKQQIIDDVMPLLWNVKLQEPEIVVRVVSIYRLMLSDKKYGLSVNLMATRVMPSLLPQTVNPALKLENFNLLLDVLQEMLNQIERNQRNKLQLDADMRRPLRHQCSTDNMHVPPFNIPNLRIEQRKTSSAEDMARKNSIGSMSMTASAENMTRKNSMAGMFGSWWFGSSSSTNDNNFLRVANTFTCRRLSDNTLMTPKIRIAPSCASSPGGTPGGGLPIRRHSSTGPQERRGSNINLSPPTGGMPITSSSVPYLLSSSMNSIRGSRRPSVSSNTSQQGILQQSISGMVRQLPPICLNGPPTLSPSPGQPSH
ncbi:SCY1-like protein 2 isoform X1 [Leptopilina heterotoma]|uniref:SCY1-like protein 2 isoform X1 n=1 Tax=Leptopilina heterotoma TaxID=63436 RepID=UPI001CA7C4AC|nr:SCY1-like protein 2 isoform X1 [Leptopilina heterotoma]XP_043463154.1 SCY1-like protein 2 isoform X1 [Leptopilina heterotoma]XP_043463155.1 SCY1-like protein 2 isoform X1 [Leptopilina heterotoma]XP_043463156.1 SCY1-like protein 2 isoform X1 [Leptopilina heterotoma]XP_043463158.1 SCY1-like protein 2 isoform X1 [Leptopilina heterotoma]XP_043463159.1 SCY1-like protein 2 isoform X1 [Leptopilina heterotoma]